MISKKKLIGLEAEDIAIIGAIRKKYGCSSDSQAVRMALRLIGAGLDSVVVHQ